MRQAHAPLRSFLKVRQRRTFRNDLRIAVNQRGLGPKPDVFAASRRICVGGSWRRCCKRIDKKLSSGSTEGGRPSRLRLRSPQPWGEGDAKANAEGASPHFSPPDLPLAAGRRLVGAVAELRRRGQGVSGKGGRSWGEEGGRAAVECFREPKVESF